MYYFNPLDGCKSLYKILCALTPLLGLSLTGNTQNCPANTPVTIYSNPNTYYPGIDASVAAGAKSIKLGASGAGATPIASGDLLLIIQMQGAQINSSNSNLYGSGVSGASGYLSNSALQAGNMEYVVAAGAVPPAGGILSLQSATVKSYKNSSFGTDGQYRYQVIRVALYYNLTFGAAINAAAWNGANGGVIVISVTNQLNFNGQKINAAAAGFRGGGARQLNGGTGGSSTDMVTVSTMNYNGSKGEGIAGTPRYVNNNGNLFDNGAANEGYPNGSYAAGAPGNAGGGGTDGNPGTNDQNSGGGGGANGGAGGKGGNSWNSNLASGGQPGGLFQQNSPSRLVMGGGGGAGTTNNGTGFAISGFSSSGAAGGGIVLLTANTIIGSGTIDVSGENGNLTVLNDGSGGGGAAGSVLLYAGSGLSNITVTATGGSGGTNTGTGSPHGPGGGGGGGIVYSNGVVNGASSVAAGAAGYTAGTSHYGAAPGNAGLLIQNVTKSQTPSQFLYCSLLPVHFTGLTAKWQQKNVSVTWQADNESGVKEYIVEKSTDGNNFTAINVESYNAATTGSLYSYTDSKTTPAGAILYYRIKAVSVFGTFMYSSIASVRSNQSNVVAVSVYPNPVINSAAGIKVTVINPSNSRIVLRLIAMPGNTVWQKQYNAVNGISNIVTDNAKAFPNGAYFLQYYNGIETITTKIIINQY